MTTNRHIKDVATDVVAIIQQAGYTTYWVGGCIRDIIMGRDPVDYDIATSATPEIIDTLFPVSIQVGKSFGVTRVKHDGYWFEIATFREDIGHSDGRRPDEVIFSDAESDIKRRDFTINAIFYDPMTNKIIDLTNGQDDIKNKIIRCVGNPADRIREDYLRILRAIRFSSILGFSIDPVLCGTIKNNAHHIESISKERIRDELTLILTKSDLAGNALKIMDELGILDIILPEVANLKGVEQPPNWHPEGDVFEHTVKMLNIMKTNNKILAFSTLLHDIGKPSTLTKKDGRIRFIGHEKVSKIKAKEILKRLRFSTNEIDTICYCIGEHSRISHAPEMKKAKLIKIVAEKTFDIQLELLRLDRLSASGDLSAYEFLLSFAQNDENNQKLPDRWVNGKDIIQMGVRHGPDIAKYLQLAYDAQLEKQFDNKKELQLWLTKKISHPIDMP